MSTEPQTYLHTYGDRVIVCETDTGRVVCGFDMSELLAIAAEKEAQVNQECAIRNLLTTVGGLLSPLVEGGKPLSIGEARDVLKQVRVTRDRLAPQHHCEQPIEMVAPADAPQSDSGHGHVRPRKDGYLARCGGPAICKVCKQEQAEAATPSPADVPLPEGLQDLVDAYPAEDIAGQLRQYAETYANAKVAAERDQIIEALRQDAINRGGGVRRAQGWAYAADVILKRQKGTA